jgi:hypothetical protein
MITLLYIHIDYTGWEKLDADQEEKVEVGQAAGEAPKS